MNCSMKKWFVCALALITLGLPALANDKAQQQLEKEILSLLRKGKYTQVKTLLEKLPVCPADNSKLYQNQIPARCTRVQFESLNLEEENRQVQDIAVQVRDTKKQSIIPVVRPANGLVAALNQYYKELYGTNIHTYNRENYLSFPKHYAGSWLAEIVPSVLARALWQEARIFDHQSHCIAVGARCDEGQAGRILYADMDWHKAQGLNLNQAAEAKYSLSKSSAFVREYLYTLKTGEWFLNDFALYMYNDSGNGKVYDGFYAEAVKHNNKKLFYEYKQYIYYKIFATDGWREVELGSQSSYEADSSQNYAFEVLRYFGEENARSPLEDRWNFFAIAMPPTLKLKMQANVAKYIVPFCDHPERVNGSRHQQYYNAGTKGLKERCQNFKEQATKYKVWPNKFEQIQREVRAYLHKISK